MSVKIDTIEHIAKQISQKPFPLIVKVDAQCHKCVYTDMVPFFTRPEVPGNTRVNFDNEGKGWERIVFSTFTMVSIFTDTGIRHFLK